MRHTLFRQLLVAISMAWCAAPVLAQTKVTALDRTVLPIPEPQHKPITEPDARKPGTGGKSILSVNGKQVAEGKIPKTQPFIFSGDEGTDVGLGGETNVSNDYKQGNNAFTGKINKVTVSVK